MLALAQSVAAPGWRVESDVQRLGLHGDDHAGQDLAVEGLGLGAELNQEAHAIADANLVRRQAVELGASAARARLLQGPKWDVWHCLGSGMVPEQIGSARRHQEALSKTPAPPSQASDSARIRKTNIMAIKDFIQLDEAVTKKKVVRLTPRHLSHMVGAQRRGVNVVRQIRAQLARYSLVTNPDFVEIHADQEIDVQRTEQHRPPYVEALDQALKRLETEPENPMQFTPRTMMGWFDAKRWDTDVMDALQAALTGFGLETNPDFRSVHVEQLVDIVPVGRASQPDTEGQASAEAKDIPNSPGPQSSTSPGDTATTRPSGSSPSSNGRFHIGRLDEANREVVCVKPQSTLRVALSQMAANQVSHLPIMRNEREVTGMLRWKDIGRYLLCNGGVSLDEPVERLQAEPVTVGHHLPFLDVIPQIIEHGYVLVRGPQRKISGIVTKKDLGRQLLGLASPFVQIGEIERGLRALIENGEFTNQELRDLARDPADPREIKGVESLTLGEAGRLLSNPDTWKRIDINVDRATFVRHLSDVREIRNDVMHFHPEGTSDDEHRRLNKFLELIDLLRRYVLA